MLPFKTNRRFLLIFVLLFALIGGYVAYKSFAGSFPSIQAEKMSLPAGAKVYKDKTASGKKMVKINKDSTTPIQGSLKIAPTLTSVIVKARAVGCGKNQFPNLAVSATADNKTKTILKGKVKDTSWTFYTASGLKVNSSNSNFTISVSYSTAKKCQAVLYLDYLLFNSIAGKQKSTGNQNHTCNNPSEHWNGSSCVCNNGAINPDNCNQCATDYSMQDGKCKPVSEEITFSFKKFCVNAGSNYPNGVVHSGACDAAESQFAETQSVCFDSNGNQVNDTYCTN